MKAKCPKCASSYKVSDEKIPETGAFAKCPKCRHRFFIEKPENGSQRSIDEKSRLQESPIQDSSLEKNVIEHKSKVFQCVRFRCKFWVEPSDRFCPNCGHEVPQTGYRYISKKILNNPLLCVVFIPALIFASSLAVGFILSLVIYSPISFLILVGICLVVSIFRTKRKAANPEIGRKPHTNLCKDEKEIETLINKLHLKALKFEKHIKAIAERKVHRLQSIKEKLEKTLEMIEYQKKEAEIGLWKIQMLRWANTLKPITDRYYKISSENECKSILNRVKKVQKNGFNLLKKWKKRKDLLALESSQKHIKNVEQTLRSIEALTEELMAKQADFAVKSVSNLDFLRPPQDDAPINQIFTMMAMAEMQENGITTIDGDIEKELSIMEAKIDLQNSLNSN
jgi:predicted Zn finger-like uncharacterized protein